jgi:lipopolysaccharide transport system ATP-binding protein
MVEAIRVENLGKRFRRFHGDRPPTLKENVLTGFRRSGRVEYFWALRNVNFSVAYGEMLGIIGHNGAGKSTLLQLIGGVGNPDTGSARANGRIGALLELGAGFAPDLTGRENVMVTAIAAGLRRRDVLRRLDRIVEFAELEASIDSPLRTYSTGMQMRLAFSVAIHTDPEVLLIDEFLSVGDLEFQSKCLQRISELKFLGCAIILISHSPGQINGLCDRAIWLRRGEIVLEGPPEFVTGRYAVETNNETMQRTPDHAPERDSAESGPVLKQNRFGSLEAEVTSVRLLPGNRIASGEPLEIQFEYRTHRPIKAPIFSVSITQGGDGPACLDINTAAMGLTVPVLQGAGKVSLSIGRIDLARGEYWVNVGIYESSWAYAYDFHWAYYKLIVNSSYDFRAILHPPCRWNLSAT